MYQNEREPFDIRDWLAVAGRRSLGLVLLAGSIGLSSCQAFNAVDDSLEPFHKRFLSQIESFGTSSDAFSRTAANVIEINPIDHTAVVATFVVSEQSYSPASSSLKLQSSSTTSRVFTNGR